MHVTSNIRNLKKFLSSFPFAETNDVSEEQLNPYRSGPNLRAHHYDLLIAKVVKEGATVTETREGVERDLVVGEWLIAPLVGRESSLGHGSVLPKEGYAVGQIIDYISTGGGLGTSPDNPPGKSDPTKVEIIGILQYKGGRIAKAIDFAIDHAKSEKLLPVVAVVGSKSDAGKTTACLEIIKNLSEAGKKVGVAKLSGTAQRLEILELAVDANQALDTADAGMPTTYPPSQENDERTPKTVELSISAAVRNLQRLSVENDVIVVEFGGDLLSASVPEILADPALLNLKAIVMAAESATAAIGMETKLARISNAYASIPQYVVGPTANLRANRNRVNRETKCAGCYDLWNYRHGSAPKAQKDASAADTKALTEKLLKHCGF